MLETVLGYWLLGTLFAVCIAVLSLGQVDGVTILSITLLSIVMLPLLPFILLYALWLFWRQ